MTIIPQKTCNRCEIEKPLTEFHPHKGNRDGYRNQCKACRCSYFRDRYAVNEAYRDHHLSRNRQHRNTRYRNDPVYRVAEQARVNQNKERFRDRIRQRYHVRYRNDPRFRKYRVFLNAKRRAQKAGGGGSHTFQEWIMLCEQYNHRCLCCGQRKKLTRDHIMPLESGGIDDISNIQPLCGPCNSRKGTKIIDYR